MSAHGLPAVTGEGGGVPLLFVRFSAALDQHRPEDVGRLFTPDAVFSPGYTHVEGRDAIVAMYAARLADPGRVTQHVWVNMLVEPAGPDEATAAATLFSYAVNPAVSADEASLQVGQVTARCVRGPDGDWAFADHRYARSFAVRLPLAAPVPAPTAER